MKRNVAWRSTTKSNTKAYRGEANTRRSLTSTRDNVLHRFRSNERRTQAPPHQSARKCFVKKNTSSTTSQWVVPRHSNSIAKAISSRELRTRNYRRRDAFVERLIKNELRVSGEDVSTERDGVSVCKPIAFKAMIADALGN